MPTQDKLAGLYKRGKHQKKCGKDIHVATELIDMTCTFQWASETSGSDAGSFSFFSGGQSSDSQSNDNNFRVLPVRLNK